MIVTIQGVKYKKKHIDMEFSPKLAQIYMMSMALGGLTGMFEKPRINPNINIIREYKLVVKKQSKLSRRQRDWVVRQFNAQYEKVSE